MDIGGHKINNWVVVGGAGGVALVLYLYRRGSSSSPSSGDTSASGTDPLTGMPYAQDDAVDPLTGMTYLAEAQEYGSVSAAESAVSSGSAYGLAGGAGSGGGGTFDAGFPTSNVGAGSVTSTSYATNAAWSQAVTTGLTGLGYSSTDVAAALGLFFAQHPLGTAADGVSYAEIIQAAEAEFGPPPQGTYSIIPQAGSTPPAAGGQPTSSQVTKYPAPGGLAVTAKTPTSVTIRWNQTSPPAATFTVALYQMNGKTAYQGTVAVPDTTGGGGTATVTGLHSKYAYTIHVWANGGKQAPPAASTKVTLP